MLLMYESFLHFTAFLQVKLDLSCLLDIKDDMDFCCKLAKEEAVVVLPGIVHFEPKT